MVACFWKAFVKGAEIFNPGDSGQSFALAANQELRLRALAAT
ncbi:hypothetical protein ACFWYW_38540 [Nonomuraea sp. NPDC059023]